ncbi:MAG: lysophospholipid acyltransferase family protein [Gallionella sp.]|nr:lysophospholipid acyltransferase family protein [Gallionella sp.]
MPAADLLSPLFALLRACRVLLHLLYGALLAGFYPHLVPRAQKQVLGRWSRELLCILNIKLHIEHPQALPSAGCMLVSNHVSWLDIFVLNAIQPAHFIAKGEVRHWPLIGWLCQRSGTIFIKRGLRRDTAQANRRTKALLEQGAWVALFPEGTTSDGSGVGHFHSSLMQPAIDTGATLIPVALRYFDSGGRPCKAAAFTGETTLARSIWRVLRRRQIRASVIFTPALSTSAGNRRMLAWAAHDAVARSLHLLPSEHGRQVHSDQHAGGMAMHSDRPAYGLLLTPTLKRPIN